MEPELRGGGVTIDNVLEICETDAKGRFTVRDEEGVLFIRVNQGHSITLVPSAVKDSDNNGEKCLCRK
jgi:RNA:NAD 2'-phosphotransferase (TPT1/KptA family)